MDFTTLSKKLENFDYEYNYELFERDLDLIWTNCMSYNKSETEYWKAAHRYRKRALTHVINARGEVLRKKLITSSQWHALLRANYLNLAGFSKADITPPAQDESASAFPDHYSSSNDKVSVVSLGHSLLSITNDSVLDILWQRFSSLDPDQVASLEVFNSHLLRDNLTIKN